MHSEIYLLLVKVLTPTLRFLMFTALPNTFFKLILMNILSVYFLSEFDLCIIKLKLYHEFNLRSAFPSLLTQNCITKILFFVQLGVAPVMSGQL